MVILINEVDDLNLLTVDPKRHPPVLGDEQTPCPLAAAGQHMRLPARYVAQLLFGLQILEEGDDALHLCDHVGLQPAGIVISMNRRNPLWITFPIIMTLDEPLPVRCQVTPYGQGVCSDWKECLDEPCAKTPAKCLTMQPETRT